MDQLNDAHPLRWAADDDGDENRGAWDTAFEAMYETGWALDEGIDDPEVVQAFIRKIHG